MGVQLLLGYMIKGTEGFNKCSGNLLSELAFIGRHHIVSFILTTQSYSTIPRPIRTSTSALIAFNMKNKREEQAFQEEQSIWENIHEL